ncbi:MAG: NAD(P)H-dependent oxidoreductase [Gammaproteobacteria bacterium]
MSVKVLCFAGANRAASYNKQLARAAHAAVVATGAEATLLDLRDFPLPLYDGDLEAAEGVPENALHLKTLFKAHQALLIAAPEYNSSITPLLKNTLDWISREHQGESGRVPYAGKVAALVAASTGALGGLRGLFHVRQILTTLGVLVLPEQLALSKAHEAFDAAGRLQDARQQSTLENIAQKLVGVTAKLGT